MLVRVCSVHSCVPLGSLCLFGCVPPIPVLPGSHGVRSVLSVCPWGRRVRCCALDPFPCTLGVVGFFRVRLCAPWGSSGSFWCVRLFPFCYVRSTLGIVGCVWSIPIRPTGDRVGSCSLGPIPCAMGCVSSFPVCPGDYPVSFGCVWSIPIRRSWVSVHSCSPWGWSGSFLCVRPIPVRPRRRWMRSVLSRAPCWSSGSFECLRPIPLRPRDRSGAFGPFWCALGVVERVRPGGDQDRLHAFGTFPYALEIVVFVRVCSVRFRAPWRTSDSFGYFRPIPVHPWGRLFLFPAS